MDDKQNSNHSSRKRHFIIGRESRQNEASEYLQLEKNKDRLIEIHEISPNPVVMFTAGGKICYINSAGRRLLEIRKDKALSAFSFLKLFPASERARLTGELLPAAVKGGQWQGEIKVATA